MTSPEDDGPSSELTHCRQSTDLAREQGGEVGAAGDKALNEFFRACGGSPHWSVRVQADGGKVVDERAFKQPFLVIGRSDRCGIRLPHPDVSRRHLYLQMVAGGVLALDLGSRNGTHWPSGAGRTGWLWPGRPVGVADYAVDLVPPTQDDDEPAESAADEPLPEVELEVVNGRLGQTRKSRTHQRTGGLVLTRQVTLLGWSPVCKFQLYDESVSRVHCSLVRTSMGVWVVDLCTRDGIRVNGEPVSFRRLDEGDELQVGEFCLRVRYGQPPGNGQEAPRTGLSESFVLSLLDQYQAMQQQMFAQNQQVLNTMLRVFGSIYEDQHELIRTHLMRLYEIETELRQLRADAAGQQSIEGSQQRHSSSSMSPPSGGSGIEQFLQSFAGSITEQTEGTEDPVARDETSASSDPGPSAVTEPAASPSGTNGSGSRSTSNGSESADGHDDGSTSSEFGMEDGRNACDDSEEQLLGEHGPPKVSGEDAPGAEECHAPEAQDATESPGGGDEGSNPRGWEERGGRFEPRDQADATDAYTDSGENKQYTADDLDAHAWLAERIGSLERERNARWQKLMRLLTGSGQQSR